MKEKTAILNCINKTIAFSFENQDFVIDLTEGDLPDSINFIQHSNGKGYDTNFIWNDDEEPQFYLYQFDGVQQQWNDSISIEIVETIGSSFDYFADVDINSKDSALANFKAFIHVLTPDYFYFEIRYNGDSQFKILTVKKLVGEDVFPIYLPDCKKILFPNSKNKGVMFIRLRQRKGKGNSKINGYVYTCTLHESQIKNKCSSKYFELLENDIFN